MASAPIYLDYAASAPLTPAAGAAMREVYERPGNASSLHGSGRRARRRLEQARESIAAALSARPSEVIVTGGGTEADNLAVKGVYWARRAATGATRIVSTAVEHHAVLDPLQWLAEHDGARVTYLPVDADGRVDPADLDRELAAGDVALATIMWANNEVGTLQPIAELAAVAAAHGVPLHSDAIAAVGHVPVSFADSGLAAMSVAAHKFGGPTGVGALLLRRDVACVPLAHGGGHERDVRSGTPDVAGVAGMAAALTEAVDRGAAEEARLATLRDRLVAGLVAAGGVVNGPMGDARLPGNAHVRFPGCEGDSLLMLLDARGIECSTGSACTAGVARASHVLLAMGVAAADARGALRLTLGAGTTDEEIDAVIAAIGPVVARARAAGMASGAPAGRGRPVGLTGVKG